jgi:pimeloyl-ACP methyl ester carboxylesterase
LTGCGTTAHTFDDFARRFTDRFHVVSYTRRGTNPSERSATGYDLATLSSDMGGFLDVLGFDRVHLVGHSFAGVEMTQFATLRPARCRPSLHRCSARFG